MQDTSFDIVLLTSSHVVMARSLACFRPNTVQHHLYQTEPSRNIRTHEEDSCVRMFVGEMAFNSPSGSVLGEVRGECSSVGEVEQS